MACFRKQLISLFVVLSIRKQLFDMLDAELEFTSSEIEWNWYIQQVISRFSGICTE